MEPITINVNVTITAPDLSDAINRLADVMGSPKVSQPEADQRQLSFNFDAPGVAEEQKKVDAALEKLEERRAKEKANSKKDEKPDTEPEETEEAPASVTDEANEDNAETYTIEDVRAAIAEVSKKKGREAAKDILTELGVKSVSNLKPDQYADAMRLAKEV